MAGSATINCSHSSSYIINNQVYILGRFDSKEMNELIGELSNLILSMQQKPIYQASTKIVSPYDIDDPERPVLDIFINSHGGEISVLNSLSTLLNIAKMRGAIIRTTVLSNAFSCGSALAIQGTPGYRIMGHDSQHMIHYGSRLIQITKEDELPIKTQQIKDFSDQFISKYKTYTSVPEEKLKKFLNCETGFINSNLCLRWKICDWIIGENGILTGRKR